jgi:ankyrin repeat protein
LALACATSCKSTPPPKAPEDVNVDNSELLYNAVMKQQADVVKKLLEQGADPNKRHAGASPLSQAAFQGNIPVMKELIQHRADVNYNDYVGAGSPLLLAVEQEKLEAVELLLEHGADPSIEAKFHGYPWDLARQSKNKKLFEVISRYRANCKDHPDRCK